MKLIIQKIKANRMNLFDVLVLLAILLIIAIFASLRFSKKSQWITVRLVVANDTWWYPGQPPPWWYVDNLTVGQVAKNTLGATVAQIVDIQSFDIGAYFRRAFIDLRLSGTYDTRQKVYLYNFQPLQVGKPLDLAFGTNNVHGIVTYIENLPQNYRERTLEVKMTALRPWVTDSYQEGLTMKDSLGRPLARILSASVSPTAAKEVVEKAGFATGASSEIASGIEKRYDPSFFRDVTLTLRIKTFQSGGVDYFVDRAAIKVGEHIWFQFPQAVARDAEITKILE